MSHKPNLLSWDQDVAASPREFHETNNNRTNSAALLATWQYFSFRHIWFSKNLSHQKLSQIILSYLSNALSSEQGKRSFQISVKLSSFAKITDKKIARHFEKHRLRGLSLRLRQQGFLTTLLQRTFTKFFNRHGLIVVKYGATLREMRFAIQA